MGSIICVEINMHNKALAEERFPTIKDGFLKEMEKNPGAKMLSPKVYLDNGLIFYWNKCVLWNLLQNR